MDYGHGGQDIYGQEGCIVWQDTACISMTPYMASFFCGAELGGAPAIEAGDPMPEAGAALDSEIGAAPMQVFEAAPAPAPASGP